MTNDLPGDDIANSQGNATEALSGGQVVAPAPPHPQLAEMLILVEHPFRTDFDSPAGSSIDAVQRIV